MYTTANWLRTLFAAVVLATLVPSALADRTVPATSRAGTVPLEDRPAAGSPEFGLLIILGAVGFLILVAWLFTRVGDDNSPSDKSLI